MSRQEFDLLYLDDFHAGDVLFVRSLAQALARMKDRRVLVVHGAGEHAERALEAAGIFRERVGGLLQLESSSEHDLLERALRHANRKITGALTDAVVPAVGVIGHERGLFRIADRRLEVGDVEWIERLASQGVVPVVAAFAVDGASGRTGEVPLHVAVEAIHAGLGNAGRVIIFTKTNLPGIMMTGSPEPIASIGELTPGVVEDAKAVAHIVSKNIPVLLTNSTGLSAKGGSIGTLLHISP